MQPQRGFTLIELSIVLVIIGLIVGGVLIGRDLVSSAQLRAQVSQLESIKTSMNTFRGKYDGYPGDLSTQLAANFGLFVVSGAICGNNDGLIKSSSGGQAGALCETLVYWRHLSESGLINGDYGSGTRINAFGAPNIAGTTTIDQAVPAAKIGRGIYVIIYADTANNYFEISNFTLFTGGGYINNSNSAGAPLAFTPAEAFSIDTKIDDGLPQTGIVTPTGIPDFYLANQAALTGATTGYCIDLSTPAKYLMTSAATQRAPACGIRTRL